jgi:hypothetical protein
VRTGGYLIDNRPLHNIYPFFQDIIRVDRNTRHNQDKIVALKQEQETLKNVVQKEGELVDNLRNVMEIVDKLLNPSLGLSLLQVAQIFNNLQVIKICVQMRSKQKRPVTCIVGCIRQMELIGVLMF